MCIRDSCYSINFKSKMNQEIAHKDEKKARGVMPFAVCMLLLSVLTLNPVTLIGTGFCFVVLKRSYNFWKDWWNCIKMFYIISLVATVLETVGLFIAFVYFRAENLESKPLREACGNQHTDSTQHSMRTAAVLFCLSVLQIVLIVKVYRAIFSLYIEFADYSGADNTELFVIDPVESKCLSKSSAPCN
eukprot:TRINITY_DN5016_c0_g1_i5.p1 TRINITY_DN5016_c0_g1~~TRINITY_DN5016_c0_g1_i5.p1  ORF type:complete len:203 (+),score=20.57 TRINITY_DN5016_c0_g1_i5:48-611(+)